MPDHACSLGPILRQGAWRMSDQILSPGEGEGNMSREDLVELVSLAPAPSLVF